MMDNFMDLLLTPGVTLTSFVAWLIVGMFVTGIIWVVLYFWPDANDRKMKESEKERQAAQTARINELADEGEAMEKVSPQARMEALQRPLEAAHHSFIEEVLERYQFWVEYDPDHHTALLVDRKWPGLTNNSYTVKDDQVFLWGSQDEVEKILRHARYVINRRAARADLTFRRENRPSKKATA